MVGSPRLVCSRASLHERLAITSDIKIALEVVAPDSTYSLPLFSELKEKPYLTRLPGLK